jgi:predicted permease
MPLAVMRTASPGYFRALGIALRRGRVFTDADRAGAPRVAVVSEATARLYFPAEDPIGKAIHPGGDPHDPPFTIVGVVADTKHLTLDEAPRPQMYVPLVQLPDAFSATMIALRVDGDPMRVAGAVRRELRALDAGVPLSDVQTFDDLIASGVSRQRLGSGLLAGFAALALLLAAVGIYGVLSYTVAQRAGEIGVRMALGAERGRVVRQVVGEGLALAALGLLVGVPGALGAGRVLAAALDGVRAADAPTLGAVAATLALVALSAAWLPAWRASRVNPVTALRAD